MSVAADAGSADRVFTALSGLAERVACAAQSSSMTDVVEADLTFSQFRTLMELGSRGTALSVHELADGIDLSVAATGRAVDRLVGLGYTDRREDPADRRVKRVSLTESGHAFVTRATDAHEDVLRVLAQRLPSDVADALADAIAPVINGEADYFTPVPPTESRS